MLEGRTDEDQVIAVGLVQRKEAAALYANLPMQQSENTIECVDGQDFTHASVVVQNKATLIFGGVVIPHASLGTPHKRRVAEDDPGLFLSGHKSVPEDAKRRWCEPTFLGIARLRRVSTPQKPNDGGCSQHQQCAQRNRQCKPLPVAGARFPFGFDLRTVSPAATSSVVQREDVGSFLQFYDDSAVGAVDTVRLDDVTSQSAR